MKKEIRFELITLGLLVLAGLGMLYSYKRINNLASLAEVMK